MTRVNFYICEKSHAQARQEFACRLAAKAFGLGNAIHIHTGSASDATAIDELLWSFRGHSFVPHALAGDPLLDTRTGPVPVVVGSDQAPADNCDLLINLAAEVPEFFSRIERVAEIVDGDLKRREIGRERYKFYRDRGYEVETHRV